MDPIRNLSQSGTKERESIIQMSRQTKADPKILSISHGEDEYFSLSLSRLTYRPLNFSTTDNAGVIYHWSAVRLLIPERGLC